MADKNNPVEAPKFDPFPLRLLKGVLGLNASDNAARERAAVLNQQFQAERALQNIKDEAELDRGKKLARLHASFVDELAQNSEMRKQESERIAEERRVRNVAQQKENEYIEQMKKMDLGFESPNVKNKIIAFQRQFNDPNYSEADYDAAINTYAGRLNLHNLITESAKSTTAAGIAAKNLINTAKTVIGAGDVVPLAAKAVGGETEAEAKAKKAQALKQQQEAELFTNLPAEAKNAAAMAQYIFGPQIGVADKLSDIDMRKGLMAKNSFLTLTPGEVSINPETGEVLTTPTQQAQLMAGINKTALPAVSRSTVKSPEQIKAGLDALKLRLGNTPSSAIPTPVLAPKPVVAPAVVPVPTQPLAVRAPVLNTGNEYIDSPDAPLVTLWKKWSKAITAEPKKYNSGF